MGKSFIPLEQQKRRSTLKRFAVHLLARDGVARPPLEIENAACAGWHGIANTLLHPNGFIVFSASESQLLETALVQLAWFDPCHFCLDPVEYWEYNNRHPCSTPAGQGLPFWDTEALEQPKGTLVRGPLRPSLEKPLRPASEKTSEADFFTTGTC